MTIWVDGQLDEWNTDWVGLGRNISKFSKDKYVLHLRRNSPWQHKKLWSSSAEKDLLPGDSNLSVSQQPAWVADVVSGIFSCV